MAGIDDSPWAYREDFVGLDGTESKSTLQHWKSRSKKNRSCDEELKEKAVELAVVKEKIKQLSKLEQKLKTEIVKKLEPNSYISLSSNSSTDFDFDYVIEFSSNYNSAKYDVKKILKLMKSRHGKEEISLIDSTCKVESNKPVSLYVRPFKATKFN